MNEPPEAHVVLHPTLEFVLRKSAPRQDDVCRSDYMRPRQPRKGVCHTETGPSTISDINQMLPMSRKALRRLEDPHVMFQFCSRAGNVRILP